MYYKFIARLREKAGAFDYDGWVETASDYEQAADAIEELQKRVPKRPHGRLIDADALKAKQQEDADLFINAVSLAEKSRRDEALNAVANIVNAPTIISAEEGE